MTARLFFIMASMLLLASAKTRGQCAPPDTTIVADSFLHHLPDGFAQNQSPCPVALCLATGSSFFKIDVVSMSPHVLMMLGSEATNGHYTIMDSACSYKMVDTCGAWDAPSNVFFTDLLRLGQKFRIEAFTDGFGTTAGIYFYAIQQDTSNIPRMVPCVTPVAIEEARETTHAYLKIDTWEVFQPPLEPGLYFVLDSQTMMPTGRKIRVFD